MELDGQVGRDRYIVMLLSIGGNNVGFANIAKWCLLTRLPSTCESLMQVAERSVQPGTDEYNTLFGKLTNVYREVLRRPVTLEKYLFITGYGRFCTYLGGTKSTSCCKVHVYKRHCLRPCNFVVLYSNLLSLL